MLNIERCTPEEKAIIEDKMDDTMVKVDRVARQLHCIWSVYFSSSNEELAYKIGFHDIQCLLDNSMEILDECIMEYTLLTGIPMDGKKENYNRFLESMKNYVADSEKIVEG